MEHTPLNSSNLVSCGYDPETRALEVTFHHGKTYCYAGVGPGTAARLKTHASPGKYLRTHIAGHFPHRVLP